MAGGSRLGSGVERQDRDASVGQADPVRIFGPSGRMQLRSTGLDGFALDERSRRILPVRRCRMASQMRWLAPVNRHPRAARHDRVEAMRYFAPFLRRVVIT